MEVLWQGLISGLVSVVMMLFVFFVSLSGRLAKIETNICWLIKELTGCQLRSKDRSH